MTHIYVRKYRQYIWFFMFIIHVKNAYNPRNCGSIPRLYCHYAPAMFYRVGALHVIVSSLLLSKINSMHCILDYRCPCSALRNACSVLPGRIWNDSEQKTLLWSLHWEFFPSQSHAKIESWCPNFDSYTSSHFDSFIKNESVWPRKLSQSDSNSTMTQLLSQVDSKKLALLLVTQLPSPLTRKLSHGRSWVNLTQFCTMGG